MLSLLSSPRSTNPTLIPCPYSKPLLSQLRSFFPLSHPFPVLASPVCQPSSQSPPQPPPAVLRFPVPWMPRTQPAARSQGRDILQFAVLCSPSFTAPHPWSRLRRLALGTSGWRAERKAFLGALPPGSPPAPQPQANVPQRAKVSPRPPACSSCVRLLPLPGKQPPPQALCGSFPGRPPTVFRSLGSIGRACLGARGPIIPAPRVPPCLWLLPGLRFSAAAASSKRAAASSCYTLPGARSFHQGWERRSGEGPGARPISG